MNRFEELERAFIEGDRKESIQNLRLIDRQELAKRLREGGRLLKHERDFLDDLVEGKKPRRLTVDAALRRDVMAEDYLHLKAHNSHLQNREIERRIAGRHGVSTGYLRRAVRSLTPQRRKNIEKFIAELGARDAEWEKIMRGETEKERARGMRAYFEKKYPNKRRKRHHRLSKKIFGENVGTRMKDYPEEYARELDEYVRILKLRKLELK